MVGRFAKKTTVRGNQVAPLLALVVIAFYGPGVLMQGSSSIRNARPAATPVAAIQLQDAKAGDRPYREGRIGRFLFDVLELGGAAGPVTVAVFRMPLRKTPPSAGSPPMLIRGITVLLLGCADVVDDWVLEPETQETVQASLEMGLLPALFHAPGTTGQACTGGLPPGPIATALAHLRKIILPGSKGDKLPAFFLGGGDGADAVYRVGQAKPEIMAGVALFQAKGHRSIVLDDAFVAKIKGKVALVRSEEFATAPKASTVRNFSNRIEAMSQSYLMSKMAGFDYPLATALTRPLIDHFASEGLLDRGKVLATTPERDATAVDTVVRRLRGTSSSPVAAKALQTYDEKKQSVLLRILAASKGRNGIFTSAAAAQMLAWMSSEVAPD